MKKLKVGDRVQINNIGTTDICEVVEVTGRNEYKLWSPVYKVFIPSVQWKKHAEKKAAWWIEKVVL